MSLKDKEKWNSKYGAEDCLAGREPCAWLVENERHLPKKGYALDLAMGEGRNALYAAEKGIDVLGVDVSDIGVGRAQELATIRGISLNTEVADLDHWSIPENAFDLVICFYFLDKNLFPAIRQGLKPGGIVIYETFNLDHLKYSGLKKEWVLGYNELLHAFADFRILNYRETDQDEKGVSSLVALKNK